MRRFVALVCLASVLTATAITSATPDQPPKPVPEPYVPPPTILTPRPGDPIGSDVTITGSTMCGEVVLWVDPPGKYYPVNMEPAPSRPWSVNISGVTKDT